MGKTALLPMLTDWHSSSNSGGADVFDTDQKNSSGPVKVEVLVWVVVELFFPFIEKRHKHAQNGTNQNLFSHIISVQSGATAQCMKEPENRLRCPSDARAMVIYIWSP